MTTTRYLTVKLRPDGTEHLGTGADRECFHRYANVENVIRFGLRPAIFPAGQYHIYHWPEGGQRRLVRTAYKLAEVTR